MIKDLKLLKTRIKSHLKKGAGQKRIGFIRPRFPLYARAMPSTRLRVYDPMLAFENDEQFILEVYTPWNHYDAVIFQKYFNSDAYRLAQKLKQQGSIVIFDVNVNFFTTESEYVSTEQYEQAIRFTELMNVVITASAHLREEVIKLFPKKNVVLIEENIPLHFFQNKVQPNNPPKTFLWVGYKQKVKELESIKSILSNIAQEYRIKMKIIGGNRIDLGKMDVDIIPYKERTVHREMSNSDVFIAPRDLSDPYNLTHTFTKIGIAMAKGIPVIASPVPSYKPSPAVFCSSELEWREKLNKVARGEYNLSKLSEQSRQYAWDMYRPEKIKEDYDIFFRGLKLS